MDTVNYNLESDSTAEAMEAGHDRAVVYETSPPAWSIRILKVWQSIVLCSAFGTCMYASYACYQDRGRRMELFVRIWTVVCLSRVIIQITMNMFIFHCRLVLLTEPPKMLTRVARSSEITGFAVWWLGVWLAFINYSTATTNASFMARIIIYILGIFYALPLLLYLAICLIFPFVVFMVLRVSRPTEPQHPTPADVIAKLPVTTYQEWSARVRTLMANSLTGASEPVVESNTLSSVLTGVNTILTGRPEEPDTSIAGPLLGDTANPLRRVRSEQAGMVSRTCPICIAEMEDDDTITAMPCDYRHFFHQHCVTEWLKTSQLCPMCRMNIVEAIQNNPDFVGAHGSNDDNKV